MNSYQTRSVRGEVRIACGPTALIGSILFVRLLDVSYADGPSVVVAEQVITDVRCQAGSTLTLRFAMLDVRIQPQARYTVSAHCDVDADGAVSIGDYISTQSYPVLTYGAPDAVVVWLHRVH